MIKAELQSLERQRFSQLKNRLLDQEVEIKDERHLLWLTEKESNQEYTIWDRLEIMSSDILGYLSQLNKRGMIQQPAENIIKHLHNMSLFETDYLALWYIESAKNYPKIKQYLEMLDYARLLILEYLDLEH